MSAVAISRLGRHTRCKILGIRVVHPHQYIPLWIERIILVLAVIRRRREDREDIGTTEGESR